MATRQVGVLVEEQLADQPAGRSRTAMTGSRCRHSRARLVHALTVGAWAPAPGHPRGVTARVPRAGDPGRRAEGRRRRDAGRPTVEPSPPYHRRSVMTSTTITRSTPDLNDRARSPRRPCSAPPRSPPSASTATAFAGAELAPGSSSFIVGLTVVAAAVVFGLVVPGLRLAQGGRRIGLGLSIAGRCCSSWRSGRACTPLLARRRAAPRNAGRSPHRRRQTRRRRDGRRCARRWSATSRSTSSTGWAPTTSPGCSPSTDVRQASTARTVVIRWTAKVRVSSVRWSWAVSTPPSTETGSTTRSLRVPWLST